MHVERQWKSQAGAAQNVPGTDLASATSAQSPMDLRQQSVFTGVVLNGSGNSEHRGNVP